MAHTRKPQALDFLSAESWNGFLETGYFSHGGKITRKIWFGSLNEKQWPAFPPDEELELAHMNPPKRYWRPGNGKDVKLPGQRAS